VIGGSGDPLHPLADGLSDIHDVLEPAAAITGLHHVRIPVSDVDISQDWYVRVLGFEAILYEEEERGPIGTVLRHPARLFVGLHLDPNRAAALRGFAVLGLTVEGAAGLTRWIAHLDRLGISHGAPSSGHLGLYIDLHDPDGIIVQLHSGEQPSVGGA
jgi:catechol 2,3-dioxygenase-like lactoylglutathione lyase family enzyme